jgi:thioredoxin-dependent peroxiredoxin
MTIKAGMLAPDFSLEDETGTIQRLSTYRGKPVVLYFYPKDDTPGCTKEACNFRDDYRNYSQAGVVILGVSPDNAQSHKRFIDKYSLPYSLLADIDHKLCDVYGVWGEKTSAGRVYDGVFRTTFVIDSSGMIVQVFENVKPDEHSKEILNALGINSSF